MCTHTHFRLSWTTQCWVPHTWAESEMDVGINQGGFNSKSSSNGCQSGQRHVAVENLECWCISGVRANKYNGVFCFLHDVKFTKLLLSSYSYQCTACKSCHRARRHCNVVYPTLLDLLEGPISWPFLTHLNRPQVSPLCVSSFPRRNKSDCVFLHVCK